MHDEPHGDIVTVCEDGRRPGAKQDQREYVRRPEVKARRRKYQQQPAARAYQRAYLQRPEVKERMHGRDRREYMREYMREYRRRRAATALLVCAACGLTAPPAETDAGTLACMHCGSTEVARG